MNVINVPCGVASLAERFAPLRQKFAAAAGEGEAPLHEDAPAEKPSGDSLEDAARGERDYVRGRLREDLGRDPSEEEVSEWLRQHTEGY